MTESEVRAWQRAEEKVSSMEEGVLLGVWDALKSYDPQSMYAPGITMDDWSNLVYGEISRRAIKEVKSDG